MNRRWIYELAELYCVVYKLEQTLSVAQNSIFTTTIAANIPSFSTQISQNACVSLFSIGDLRIDQSFQNEFRLKTCLVNNKLVH